MGCYWLETRSLNGKMRGLLGQLPQGWGQDAHLEGHCDEQHQDTLLEKGLMRFSINDVFSSNEILLTFIRQFSTLND